MAERRMMAKSVIETDKFMDMPMSAQCLYFHLLLRADDDGFIKSPKTIKRSLGCSDDDMKILIAKQYLIPFDTGVIVIKHWRIHNYVQKDRYKQSDVEEWKLIELDEHKEYQLKSLDTECIQSGYSMDTSCIQIVSTDKNRIDKNRIDKNRIDKNRGEPTITCYTNAFELWDKNITPLTPIIGEKLKSLVEDCGEAIVCEAISEAAIYNKRSFGYVKAVAEARKNGVSGKKNAKTALDEELAKMGVDVGDW